MDGTPTECNRSRAECRHASSSDDGLEREFNFFNVLEGGMCTMCAPGDQRKFSNNQRDQRCTDGTLSQ
jgi:hypothetical protein